MYTEIAERIIDLMAKEGYIRNPEEASAEQLAGDMIEPGYMETICDSVQQIAEDHRTLNTKARRHHWEYDSTGEKAVSILTDIRHAGRCAIAADHLMNIARRSPEAAESLREAGVTDIESAEDILWSGDIEAIRKVSKAVMTTAGADRSKGDLYWDAWKINDAIFDIGLGSRGGAIPIRMEDSFPGKEEATAGNKSKNAHKKERDSR